MKTTGDKSESRIAWKGLKDNVLTASLKKSGND